MEQVTNGSSGYGAHLTPSTVSWGEDVDGISGSGMGHLFWFTTISSGSIVDDVARGGLMSGAGPVGDNLDDSNSGSSTIAMIDSDGIDLLSSIGPSLGGMEGELGGSTPTYIATICIMSIILLVGITGNVLVPIVIAHSKDLRNSTNIFLVNLALADLLVILICLPTGFVELHSTPGVWYLGETMCLVVTFVELIAPHTSVLTILAISFERYYAICQPLRAGYVCTKSRAMAISLFTWLCAGLLTSPIIGLTNYGFVLDDPEPSCGPSVEDYWTKFYYMASFMLFFLIPCIILLVLYALIAQHLIREPARISNPSSAGVSSAALAATAIVAGENHALGGGSGSRQPRRRNRIQRHQNSNRARRQVVAMLGAVVVSFFVCLLPYRLLSLFQESEGISPEIFYMLVNFCRVMVYLNSAINPILYNLMSSKFRNGFLRLFGLKGFARQGTVTSSSMTNTNTTSTTASSSNAVAQANASLAHHGTLSLHRPLHYRLSSQQPT
ncbi:thyrotropin-releasing hormone receptor-like [Daphnia carinata]|uniref:thyrotropin-releasing hormone receptor-like n=1 Tax=Daphnia carinata TaxID=120202 RepID=UPI00257F10EE|nr:thyrotropin-releasing hormone receptor-like [Daphnia carinata]